MSRIGIMLDIAPTKKPLIMSDIGIMRDIIGGFGDCIRVFFVLLNGKAVI